MLKEHSAFCISKYHVHVIHIFFAINHYLFIALLTLIPNYLLCKKTVSFPPTTNQNQTERGAEQTAVVAGRICWFQMKKTAKHYVENRKEDACTAAHSAFLYGQARSVMFPFKYLHCVQPLYLPSFDLLPFNSLLSFFHRKSKLKGLRGRMQTRHFPKMYRHPIYMPKNASDGYFLFLSLLHFHILNAISKISEKQISISI